MRPYPNRIYVSKSNEILRSDSAVLARVASIGTQTLYRWMKEPEFQAAYLEARRAAVAQSNARLQQASSAAVSTLRALRSLWSRLVTRQIVSQSDT
jgi:hypothetical protein